MEFTLKPRKTGTTTETWEMRYRYPVITGGKATVKAVRESTGIPVDRSTPEAFEVSRRLAHGEGMRRMLELHEPGFVGRENETLKVSALLKQYQAVRTRRNAATMAYCCRYLDRAFGALLANKFDPQMFMVWRDKMNQVGYSHGTIDRITRVFRAAFHFGRDAGLVRRMPFLPCYNEDDARQGFLEAPEYLAFHNALVSINPDAADLWDFGYYCGCRPAEAENLLWTNVSLEDKTFTFVQTKIEDWRTVTTPQCWAIIEKRWAMRAYQGEIIPTVFHHEGQPFTHHTRQAALDKAKTQINYTGTRVWYDLRRTFYRNAINAGVPEVTVMAITGHKTRAMAKRYAIRNVSDQWAAGEMLQHHLNRALPAVAVESTSETAIG